MIAVFTNDVSVIRYTYVCRAVGSKFLQTQPTTVQITHSLNGTHVSHTYYTRGVNYSRVGFLGSTNMYMHTAITHMHVFTYVHACMATVAS